MTRSARLTRLEQTRHKGRSGSSTDSSFTRIAARLDTMAARLASSDTPPCTADQMRGELALTLERIARNNAGRT